MKTNQLIKLLSDNADATLHMILPSGEAVPYHFHVTEVGHVRKNFIDCGGTHRESTSCLLQIWTAHDADHRLLAGKLSNILKQAGQMFGFDNLPVEVEYGIGVASQYVVDDVVVIPNCLLFVLSGKQTDCLAPDKCGVNQCSGGGCC